MSTNPPRRHCRPTPLSALLCDDCCCGTQRKHPGIDHVGIHNRLRAAAESAGGRGRRVGCLGVCERSNVVVLKSRGSGSLWIGEVLDEPIVAALEAWIRCGAPAPVPTDIAAHVFERPSSVSEPVDEPVALQPNASS